jgi:hypothetical protein
MRLTLERFPFWVAASLLFWTSGAAFALQAGVLSSTGRGPLTSADSTARYTLKGTVINSLSGEPVSRALVQIYQQGQRSTLTDREGHFQFDSLPQMLATLNVRKPGYFDGQTPASHLHQRTSLQIGPDTPPVILKLVPEAIVAGHVYDENGEPLAQVPIKMSSFRITNGRRQWQQMAGTNTNEDGEFRIANQMSGEYYLSAGPSIDRTFLQTPDAASPVAYASIYYPDSPDLQSAASIRLSAGQHVQADFSLRPTTSVTISGAITGYPVGQGVELRFLNASGEDVAFARRFNPQDGRFDARIPSLGPCTIKARSQDAQGHSLIGEVTVNATTKISGIEIGLAQAVFIPITIRLEETKPPADYHIAGTGQRLNYAAHVHLIPEDRLHQEITSSNEGDPQHPVFAIRNLEPGIYRVEANPQGPWYIQSATYAGADLLSEPLVAARGATSPIELVLRDDGGTLAVTVPEMGTGKQATIVAVPDRAPSHVATAQGFGGSQIQMMQLAPGGYKVFAFDTVDSLEYTNPEVLRAYGGQAAFATVQPDQKSSITLDLIRTQE